MVITSFEKNKKNKDMVSVFIDSQYAFSLPEEEYLRLGLYDKNEISDEELYYIRKEVLLKNARSKAIKCISFKLLSEKELFIKLESKGFDEETIRNVIDDLKAIGYVNDKIYAQKFVFERSKLKPKSKKMLRMELSNRGITDDIIDEVLENFEYDEVTIIERLIRKKFGKYDLSDPKVEIKVISFLVHRGFCLEMIKKCLYNIKNDE
ncbi:MAG: Regulatory protein RecX [Firmicutes bacterium ADurb.Bin419]|nr:MAG: Regulatory protein RecX [Firmicutes bacterium ADurb.Bin419]